MYSWEGKADFIEAITAVFSVTLFLRNHANFALKKYFCCSIVMRNIFFNVLLF